MRSVGGPSMALEQEEDKRAQQGEGARALRDPCPSALCPVSVASLIQSRLRGGHLLPSSVLDWQLPKGGACSSQFRQKGA